ncbi:hypothetical protein [Thermodesulfitimonas autotrophica]|uniref:hypothetical protein n=1 Tax=Thermodesulfitimonas autotrophica TaxID=1894989 RepID=UPI000F5138F6|nr:hypothetical protein [Thermodesulfitimonas autotrophica]
MADGVDLDKPQQLRAGNIRCEKADSSSFKLPEELAPFRNDIVKAYNRGSFLELTDGTIARLESFAIARAGASEFPVWVLKFGPLSYFDFICTNLALTPTFKPVVLPKEVLEALGRHRQIIDSLDLSFHEILRCQRLGNGLTIHLNIIDTNGHLLVGRRPPHLSIYGGKLVTSVTGAVNWQKDQLGSAPDIFLAAIRETKEETGIRLNREDIVFYALGMQADQRHPLLLGAAKIKGNLAEAMGLGQDAWENEIFYYLDLEDIKTAAAVLRYGDWIPASAVAVALSLLDVHGYEKLARSLSKADKRSFRAWSQQTPWLSRQKQKFPLFA